MRKSELMLVAEACRVLRLRPDVVRNLLFLGVLDGHRDGGRWRCTSASVYRVRRELDRPLGVLRRGAPGCVLLARRHDAEPEAAR
jgi:hypothetical protein